VKCTTATISLKRPLTINLKRPFEKLETSPVGGFFLEASALDRLALRGLSVVEGIAGEATVLRTIALILGCISFCVSPPASAQVTQQDQSLQEQFVPESFKLDASAVSSKFNWLWSTTASYTIINNSGMNLYLGVRQGGATIGSCTDAQMRGALQFLPNPHGGVFSVDPQQGEPRGAYVPAGARAVGAIVFSNCPAPNPGFPTAPLSISLMVGKSESPKTMTATFPLSVDVPIRQLQSQ